MDIIIERGDGLDVHKETVVAWCPVRPAVASPSAKKKKADKRTSEGFVVHSFSTLMATLGTRCRNRCRICTSGSSISRITEPIPLQAKAFQLLGL
jgi:hypothetical protein